MRLPAKLLAWKYGVVLVLFVILSVLNVVAVEQDYYKVTTISAALIDCCGGVVRHI